MFCSGMRAVGFGLHPIWLVAPRFWRRHRSDAGFHVAIHVLPLFGSPATSERPVTLRTRLTAGWAFPSTQPKNSRSQFHIVKWS